MTRPTRTVRNRYELPSIGGDLAWQERAACAGTDLGLWFRPDGRDHDPARVRRAKGYCLICEAKPDCLDWAFKIGDGWAVLGGTTPDERRRMRRREQRRVAT